MPSQSFHACPQLTLSRAAISRGFRGNYLSKPERGVLQLDEAARRFAQMNNGRLNWLRLRACSAAARDGYATTRPSAGQASVKHFT